MEKIKKRKRKKYEMAGLFFILPSLIGVSKFILIPFADVVIRSFQSPITRDFVFFHKRFIHKSQNRINYGFKTELER